MELSERKQSRHDIVKKVWDFFETIPFYRMRPRQDLVDHGFCLAEEGREYLVYLPAGGTVNVALKDGTYRVSWIDARNTKRKRPAGRTTSGKKLSAPSGGDDWLLRLINVKDAYKEKEK